jgi:hypothetical protein
MRAAIIRQEAECDGTMPLVYPAGRAVWQFA